jgi:hypothetical protein
MSSCTTCTEKGDVPCPSRMADGRAFTDYRPRCAVNAELIQALGTKPGSAYESRMFLQRNANSWMDAERVKSVERLAPCAPCRRPTSDPGTMLPERYVVRCDGVTCSRNEVNPAGLGDGRMY